MSLRRFFVAGPCWTGDCACRDFDGLDERPDLRPPLHDGCVCYLAEERAPVVDLPPLKASCRRCATHPDKHIRRHSDRLFVAILGDRQTIEVTCAKHGLVGKWRLESRVEEGCELCGEGETCRH